MGGTRIATVATDGTICYYHTNHLETPEAMTDQSGALVWTADYKPFGEAMVDPSSTVVNDFRFPGQILDRETGYHYNWNRYYDPGTGRYLTADPIGLAGGINLYAYVEGNPVNMIDPSGLCPPGYIQAGNDCWPMDREDYFCGPGYVDDESGSCYKVWPKEDLTAKESYGICTVKCIGKVALGEAGTQLLQAGLQKIAKELAWKFGQKAIPYAGWVSTAYSGFSALNCFVECIGCED